MKRSKGVSELRLIAPIIAILTWALLASSALAAVNPPTFSMSVGSEGTGNGQFHTPRATAVDSAGNVWVLDAAKTAARAQKFNSKGEYQFQFGSYGSGNGQFLQPYGIAIDPTGNIWIADTGNHRVQKFNSKGEFLLKFGTLGSGNGQFSSPYGIAIDPTGNVWVADTGNDRVQKFNSKGEFLLKSGSAGTGDGKFQDPKGIVTDSDGNVWVADNGNDRIQKLDSKGRYLDKYGESGFGDGQLEQPADIEIDAAGNLWVADFDNRVQGIYPEGEYFTKFGKGGSGEGEFSGIPALAIGPAGEFWVVDFNQSRIQKWAPGAPYPVTTTSATAIGRTKATLNALVNPQGKATSYQFEYGTTQEFGTKVPLSPKSIGSGSSAVKVSEVLSGLKAGTTYYYHVAATSGAGSTYGETRHFKTQAPATAEAKWRFDDKTLAELGLGSATFSSSGKMTISMPSLNATFKCTETTTGGTISGTSGIKETVTLTGCVLVGVEKQCNVEPISLGTISGTIGAPSGEFFTIKTTGVECPWFSSVGVGPVTYSFEVGSEGVNLPVNTYGQGFFGKNPVFLTGVSEWWLTGAQNGKVLGFW